MTMILVETQTLNGSAASVVFNSIPQDATDLVAMVLSRSDRSTSIVDSIDIRPNGQTGSMRRLFAESGGAGGTDTIGSIFGLTSMSVNTANTFGSALFYIPNYTATVAKCVSLDSVQETNSTQSYLQLGAGLTTTTAAITSITFAAGTGNLVAGTIISLYKITKGTLAGVVVS